MQAALTVGQARQKTVEELPRELLIIISLNLSISDCYHLSLTSRSCNVVDDSEFWRQRLLQDYRITALDPKTSYRYQPSLYISGKEIPRFRHIAGIFPKSVASSEDNAAIVDIDDNVWILDETYIRIPKIKAKRVVCSRSIFYIIDLEDHLWLYRSGLLIPLRGQQIKEISAYEYRAAFIDKNDDLWTFWYSGFDNSLEICPRKLGVRAQRVVMGCRSMYIIDLEYRVRHYNRYIIEEIDNLHGGDLLPNLLAKEISIGCSHDLLIDLNDRLLSSGDGFMGELGLGEQIYGVESPTVVPGMKVRTVMAGNKSSFCIDFEDNLWVFGSNIYGQLGLGDMRTRYSPVKIEGIKVMSCSLGYQYGLLMGYRI